MDFDAPTTVAHEPPLPAAAASSSSNQTTNQGAHASSLDAPSSSSSGHQQQPKDDPRVDFIRKLVLRTFPALQLDKLHQLFASDHVATMLFEFLHVPDARLLLFTDHGRESSSQLKVYATPPPNLFGETPVLKTPMTVLYMVKTLKGPVQMEKPFEDILSGTLERNALESLAHLLQEILIPLIGNPRNQKRWPEMVTNSVLNNVHGFFSSLQITVGQTRGATCLPLPWDQVLTENQNANQIPNQPTQMSPSKGVGASGVLVKDHVHGLEGCLITWTKQIKNILKQDPETLLNKKLPHSHPGPMEELFFWASKAKNLNSIFAQLQSDGIRKVLQYLDASKSTYNVPFAKLCKEVFLARAEANENVQFLQPLTQYFHELSDPKQDFLSLRNLFRPICHSILLVWKCSRFYNTPSRLVVLIRQICNAIIRQATQFLNGKILFELIDQDLLEKANSMLLVCLQVCAQFKSVYFDYKAKSVLELPTNPWRIQNNALFIRLDAFLERCHDVLELTQTIYQFQKLALMEIGGTKGKTLTTSVHQIFADFQETLVAMKAVQYDLMDLDAKHFEDDFYTFRSKNKELERRLASVINQAFDDAKTISSKFKCLDCFEDFLDRAIIKNELERKYTLLIANYAADLHLVQQIFIENRDFPPIPCNFPPFAGAVSWCRGLVERIQFPMEKLKRISPRLVLEREDSKDAIKLFTNVVALLQEYQVQMVAKWGITIEASSKEKLKLPLLVRRTPETIVNQTLNGQNGVLVVNFDPALVQLLREVKYFVLLGIEIPEEANAIYKKAESFRRQTGNLELIVDTYNSIHANLLQVEKPLVKTHLDRMDQALLKGMKALNWKSHGIDVFLKESFTDVNEANTLLSQLKTHQARVNELIQSWIAPPLLFERKTAKPMSVNEFEELQKALCAQKYNVIKEGGNEIHRLLKDSLKTLRVSQGSPDWRAYVDYVSALVEDGLTKVVLTSLSHLRDQLDPKRIEKDDLSALVEVELDLYGKEIVFFPVIGSTSATSGTGANKTGLRDVILKRIEAIFHCTTVFKRLDSSEGSYLKELRENVDVLQLVADISKFLDQNEAMTSAFRQEMAKYEYLWTTDLPQMFATFLATAWTPPEAPVALGGGGGGGGGGAGCPLHHHQVQYADQYPSPPAPGTKQQTPAATAAQKKSSLLPATTPGLGLLPPMPAQLLELSKFEDKISFFLSLQNEISDAKPAKDVGFVRVNALPIKQALSTWVTKWIYMFTQFLHDRVVNQLCWLDQFMTRVTNGLDHEIENSVNSDLSSEKTSLMSCMHHIRDVRRLMREDILVNFTPLKEIVLVLKQNGIALEMSYVGKENVLAFLEQAPLRWENMVNKTFKKKELIQPFQSQMVETIRTEIGNFGTQLHQLKQDFSTCAPFEKPILGNVETAFSYLDDAYLKLDLYDAKLVTIEREASRLVELEDMFELAPSKNDILPAIRSDLAVLKQVWDLVALVEAAFCQWQQLLWLQLDTERLAEQAEALERLRGLLFSSMPRIKEWPIYQFVDSKIQQMVVVLPLIKHLKSPVLRERHWKSLMVLTRKHFDFGNSQNANLKFEDILKMELHRFVNEVNELIEVATREFKIEQQLNAIETTWQALALDFVPYKTTGGRSSTTGSNTTTSASITTSKKTKLSQLDEEMDDDDDEERMGDSEAASTATGSGDLWILKPPNAILECLEDHQLQLQTMASMGKFVLYFKDKVLEWQIRLGNVDLILKMWISLQKTWCSLESIFLSSASDIQAQLPMEFQKFQHVDDEIKELFHDAVKFPNVLVACCHRDGRELVLRDLHKELEICQKALNAYLDGKKDIFPRFYFVSNASLLDILSNGNCPPKLQSHFGNCFDGIQQFDFEMIRSEASASSTELNPTNKRRISVLPQSQQQQELGRFMATAMVSKEGEVVRFMDSLLIHGAVENWFMDLVRAMQETLKDSLSVALDASALWGVDMARHAWVFEYAAQVALVASQIIWTEEVEAALEELENGTEDALKKYVDLSSVRLEALIKLVQSSGLSSLDRMKIITLITIDVHARDVVQSLISKKVTSALDFPWQSQLRYYVPSLGASTGAGASSSSSSSLLLSGDVSASSSGSQKKASDVVIKICDFRSFYSYEYTGNCGRLVITPLTDRCYVTLTTALRLCLGGAPAGPAGTGKTETTKDLARSLGLQCYVFNCSDQMNYKTMADVFKGLAQTGAWGCFDEFNRISVEVLSVVATQVKTVLDALSPLAATLHRVATACSSDAASSGSSSTTSTATAGEPGSQQHHQHQPSNHSRTTLTGSCDFFGKTISLVPTVGLFITMNPGYAGRAELPENLKALFRSCAMIKPDLQPICENMLMAEGFLKARVLSVKFVTLYDLSSELLSQQKHYDWGLRAVKSVLLVAGSLLRQAGSQVSEENVLMQVLRDFNTPRLLPADYPIFCGLLNDLFPGQTTLSGNNQSQSHQKLQQTCIKVCQLHKLQPEDSFLKKVMEFDDVLAVRHSVMLIGPAGCGKTTVWSTLAATHNYALQKPTTVYETINPKAVTADELYGSMTLENDWKDGVLSCIMRNMAKEIAPFHASQSYKWVVLDGDIDAVWIESMNTVMDDNKMLTLVSNERIPLTKAMRMVFEIHSLQNATPATVSRAGIIYVHEGDIGWAPFAESWIARRNPDKNSENPDKNPENHPANDERGVLSALFHKYVDPMLTLLKDHRLFPVVPLPEIAYVSTLCHLLDGMLDGVCESDKSPEMLENAFMYCLMWAFGGPLDSDKGHGGGAGGGAGGGGGGHSDQRQVFSTHFKALAKFKNVDSNSSPAGTTGATGATPHVPISNLNVFDVRFDPLKNEFVPWSDCVPPFATHGAMAADVPFHQLIVPTLDTTRCHALIALLLTQKCPILLVGAAGTGKTSIITDHLKTNLDPDEIAFAPIKMHFFMDAKIVQLRMEKYVEKRSGKVFGPLQNRKLVYFLDDLNMPFVENYGTQTPIAFLRQFMDYGAWYDRSDLSFKKQIHDVQFIAAMNHKTGSFTLNPRFQRHFATFACPMSSKSDLMLIFGTLLSHHVHNFSDKIKKMCSSIVSATMDLYFDVSNNFVPSATKFHYIFSLRDLQRVFQGLFCARADAFGSDTIKFAKLWLHETCRVFSDRMASASDAQRFQEMAFEQAKKHFDDDANEVFNQTPLICASFLGGNNSNIAISSDNDSGSSNTTTTTAQAAPYYVPVSDKGELTKAVALYLQKYNESGNAVMKLVLFDQALQHITRIVRVLLLQPSSLGHLLLIGVGGSGKQSLSKLACFICGFKMTTLSSSSVPKYGISELKDDLKEIYRFAGVRPATPVVLMVTDSQLQCNPDFLIYVNEMVTTGEIPDLFTSEEMDAMLSSLKIDAKAKGIPDTKDHLQAFFYDRVKMNLHLILTCSPVGNDLRQRCRQFPSLISGNCAMNWFHAWPKDALVDVAMQFLQTEELETPLIQENVCHHMAEMHLSVTNASAQYALKNGRFNYVTPTSFLELIRLYQTLLHSKRTTHKNNIKRLDVGLLTLKKTAQNVFQLQMELRVTMQKVDEKKKNTEQLLDQMGKQRGDAEQKQKRADDERAKAGKAAEIASKIESQASVELMIAKPALDAAQQAVNCLNKASLTELKSMGKPPPGVEKVTAAVLMLLKNEKTNFSWDNAKKMMAKVDLFKQALEQFDKENIPSEIITRVEPILEDPNFNYEKMKTKSLAAANLCVWVVNIVAFHHVFVRVKPLMDTLDSARQAKKDADVELEIVEKMVAQVEAQLQHLQFLFRDATNEKAKVEAEAHACQGRLSLAERLVNGLASENERWTRESELLKMGTVALIGDTLLASGFVSYIGAFNAKFRIQLWKFGWLPDLVTREIPISWQSGGGSAGRSLKDGGEEGGGGLEEGDGGGGAHDVLSGVVDPVAMLSDGSAVAQWMNEGLPADRISIENGCIITSCERWPLLVDPQLQGLKWLRARDFGGGGAGGGEGQGQGGQGGGGGAAPTTTTASETPSQQQQQQQQKTTGTKAPAAPQDNNAVVAASTRNLMATASSRQVVGGASAATTTKSQRPLLGQRRKSGDSDGLAMATAAAAMASSPDQQQQQQASLSSSSSGATTGADSSATSDVSLPLVILLTSQKMWLKSLKTAISTGQNVILENLGETLDATLEPVLMRQVYKKGRTSYLHFAAEEIEYDPKFRLFLHTKLPNPHFRPEILAYCTLIDFSVTETGLEDQLLANVVNLEQPFLEKHKQRLQQEFNGYQIQLLELENQLLERLSNAPEDILSDVPLIEGLEKTKQTANEVSIALIHGKEAEKEINLAREVYRPVASEASMLYFAMCQLCHVNHMYRYSLESFMTFFYVAMAKIGPTTTAGAGSTDPNQNLNQNQTDSESGTSSSFFSSASYSTALDRVPQLKEALRWTLFVMVSRGLFEEHKFIFLTQLVFLLLKRQVIGGGNTGFTNELARFLLQNPKLVGPENPIPWLSESQWQSLQALITLEPFERFVADLEESEARFKEWYNSPTPELEKLPLDWRELDKTFPFLKLLVVRCMRPDRLTQALHGFIANTLPHGHQYLTCDAQLNSFGVLQSAFGETTAFTPVFFILSPGCDVVADVDKLAVHENDKIKGVDYHNIALGQGQEAIAMEKLQLSVANGHWIILNNVHLMPKWLLELDKWLEQLAKSSQPTTTTSSTTTGSTRQRKNSIIAPGVHPNFRLFITSDPSPNLPIGVLEKSIKLTNEPPSGLKANVKRAFCCFAKPEFDELEPRTRVILFAMCYFHSLMLERKKFGTQGFNLVYPFASSDLISSSIVLRNYMEGNAPAKVPWADLRYLFGEIMYGGHIVNESDRFVSATYLGYFLRDELLEEVSMVPYAEEQQQQRGGGGSKSGGDDGDNGGGGGGDGESGGGGGGGGGSRKLDFLAPKLSAGYDRMLDHIDMTLQNESPTAFGLHPNAEFAFRTAHGDRLMATILVLSRKDDEAGGASGNAENTGIAGSNDDSGSGSGDSSNSDKESGGDAAQMVVEGVLQDILENYRELRFDIHELCGGGATGGGASGGRATGGGGGAAGRARSGSTVVAMDEMDPFQNVLLQECERMNVLLDCMTKSLVELEMAFRGEITLTDTMETLQDCLYYEKIPVQWERVAYPSRRSLAPWLANLQQRITQLQEWVQQSPELPTVLWFPGLFNPQSFLTAIVQTSARKNGLELDKLSVMTDITKRNLEGIDAPSRDGQYIHGLALEGARWDLGNGMLESSQPKEMYVHMPVMNVRAVLSVRKDGAAGASGSGGNGNVYECPVYRTQQRGPTFVFSAQLKTKHPPSKWILAGVALLMEIV